MQSRLLFGAQQVQMQYFHNINMPGIMLNCGTSAQGNQDNNVIMMKSITEVPVLHIIESNN